MRDGALSKVGLVILLGALAACSEPTNPATQMGDASRIQAANAPGTCDLINSMRGDVSKFFTKSDNSTASDKFKQINDACGAGNQAATTALSWELLTMMETALNQHQIGSIVAGNNLTNELLACTISLCKSASLPGINFTGSLSTLGLFAVRGANTTSAIARDRQPFTDFNGNANSALWGLEVDEPWPAVTGANTLLLYGSPDATLSLQETQIGNLRYDMKTYPDIAFADGKLHVGVCFATAVVIPPIGAGESQPLMRREGVLLERATPGFCAPLQGSLIGSLTDLARRVLPRAITSRFFLTSVGGVGGSPLDFSRFAPIAANAAGTLEFLSVPPKKVVAGQPIGTIQVRAKSGDGTPIERVQITLTLVGNYGEPAGASLSGDLVSLTQELNTGIAVFPDDGNALVVGKAGGYRICANASLNGFTFSQICTDVFNASNP